MRLAVCWGLAVALATAAVATAGGGKDDQAKLQGTWTFEKDGKTCELKFAKNDFTITFDRKDAFKGTFKIDASKKPKQMDLTITEGEKFKGETAQAIYELDGDTLKWCASEPGKAMRPTEFPTKEGDGPTLFLVFKRAK
jgi:uncharacterized protein (TIGR03067 family)